MSFWKKIEPTILKYSTRGKNTVKLPFNVQRIWFSTIFFISLVSIGPLVSLAIFDYTVTKDDTEKEIHLRMERLVDHIAGTVSFFLEERKTALSYIVYANTFADLNNKKRLAHILEGLQRSTGGFVDIGLIDSTGKQLQYVGPYNLEGMNYRNKDWCKKVQKMEEGVFISEIFLGYRNVPHHIIAVRQDLPDGSFFILRATMDTEKFNTLLSLMKIHETGDSFLINHQGVIQTPTLIHGVAMDRIKFPIHEDITKLQVYEEVCEHGDTLVIGLEYIPDSPYILMIIQEKEALMKVWLKTRWIILGILAAGIIVMLFVIIAVASYLINMICKESQKTLMVLSEVEYSSKMASIGRLAAGVAHEVNNPLAIINEKAGLMKDLFTYKDEYSEDPKLMGLIDSVLYSVERCSGITRRLLSFSRNLEVTIQVVNMNAVIEDVLSFLHKEAEYRSITVNVDVAEDVPDFETDRGKLQQILVNLTNNAFAALEDEGRLDIRVRRQHKENILITIMDDGCGISKENIKHIFDPFFSTKTESGGTGLGLSIIYGLALELGGKIDVESEEGKGTLFTVTLPIEKRDDEKPPTDERSWDYGESVS
ncbi:MAG: two-component sensor histidine kinase [Desulfobulbaceae bacterium]|nr:two-component sensor histidine kinase [Desulfobulbaceae bacterium]